MSEVNGEIHLIPRPRRLERTEGSFVLPNCGGKAVKTFIDPAGLRPQGYRLSIDRGAARIAAYDVAGEFYGRQTLAQLVRQFGQSLPFLEIEDWPDFPARGVMLDISRDKVPTMATLLALVDQLSHLKINQLQLYTEHTFAYRDHREVWAAASPMTAEEIWQLDLYCRQRFIELVPNQNSFGHMERWLKHARYLPLAEMPEGTPTPWGHMPFSLCPTDPRSIELLAGLYEELLPNFTSRLFNVGCDETFDLGKGRSKQECERRGTTRVYLDFLKEIHSLVARHGRTMMFWGDIILNKPELIEELPKDVIALEWGYEANHPFDRDGSLFAAAGVPFYVCPGTSSWNSIAGRTDNMLGNLRSAAENGKKHGAMGYLVTDWGDHGHLQYLPVSYAAFAAGAAYAWCFDSNGQAPLAHALDLHIFRDRAQIMAKLALDLGNVYQSAEKLIENRSVLFSILVPSSAKKGQTDGLTREGLVAAEAAIDAAMARIAEARMERPDAAVIADEFRNAAEMLRYVCRVGRSKLHPTRENVDDLGEHLRRVVGEHRRLWLLRNRPGGLEDSCRRLRETSNAPSSP